VTQKPVVVSTIGDALRRRGIGVSELRRRLATRGVHVSRGALDRLASDQPLRSVNFDLLLAVLEELGLTLGAPFRTLPPQELDQQRAARALARQATRDLANGRTASTAVGAALDPIDQVDEETSARAEALLRRQHPEAFDTRGRLRKRALARALASRFGSKRLSREQVDAVIAAGRAAAARRRGAG